MAPKQDLLSIFDLTKGEIDEIFSLSLKMKGRSHLDLCQGSVLASCFYEPSTRTRLSFESAMIRLGGSVIGFSEGSTTSAKKGETLHDSIRVIGSYADILVIRHPEIGSAKIAAAATTTPVINGGDGANEHPSQTLVDLFTIFQSQGKLDHLSIAIAGDLKYGRAARSLALALAHYKVHLYFVSPPSLPLSPEVGAELKKRGVAHSFHHNLTDVIDKVDVLYMTRIQKERFQPGETHPHYCLTNKDLVKAKKTLHILHPLPRVDEIDVSVDASPHAYYFQQAANGVPVRMALLAKLLRKA